MLRFLVRMLIVVAVCVAALVITQHALTRDEAGDTSGAADGRPPTRQVTVADVIAAKIPSPVLTRVSLPGFSYRDAFPDATGGPEVVITRFGQAPMLTDRGRMPEAWRRHYPETLPPVAERLPRNPAVVRGPDGIGQYGGVWRRCTNAYYDIDRKIGSESFVRFDPSGRVQPGVAYKWEVTDSNRVYTFHLRKGHRWSDGHPFTTADILCVCNTLIGSAHWPSPPNWMQATDGTAMLYVADVLDWPGLAAKIVQEASAEGASPGRQVAGVGGKGLLDLFKQARGGPPPEAARYRIVGLLNKCFRRKELFDAATWAGLDLNAGPDALRRRGASRLSPEELERLILLLERNDLFERARQDVAALSAAELSKLNLLLFRAAYRGLVDIARLKRVKIEAVPDADGDTSHIIRFTFPRPNAIFLEKTATFMFYRGLFGLPRHYTSRYHPQGSAVLNVVDVLDWPGFLRAIQQEGTPPGRLQALLDESTKQKIAAGPAEADRRGIVDAVNKALNSKMFYDEAAWSGIDLSAEYGRLVAKGFSQLRRDRAGMNRAKQLLVREDLLARVHKGGIGGLSDAERFRFNLMMLRAACQTGGAGAPLVAKNREDALNRAAQSHPRKYTSWVNQLRALGNYHPDENPHMPTLGAWRVVSEKKEPVLVAVRNPYYYKVDVQGNQLPYIDAIETIKETRKNNILMKLASGGVHFQCREISFEDFTVLKQSEKQGGYEIRLWANDYCGEVTFYPLQAHKDPVYARLFGDRRFRHALSLALNRQEIIDVVYKGIGAPAQFSVPKGSPYYSDVHAKISIKHDPDKANRLLDEMGLTKRAADGTRLLWDGRPLIINLDAAPERPLPVVQMAAEYFRKIGVNARVKIRSGSLLNRYISIGILDVGVHKEGGNYFGPLCAGGYAPTHPAECGQWAQWVAYMRSGGRSGWEPPDRMHEIERLWEKVITAPNDKAKLEAWQRLSERTARDLPIIGLMTSPGKPVYVRNDFKNVPKLALAGWIAHEPANCCPEVFYIEQRR